MVPMAQGPTLSKFGPFCYLSICPLFFLSYYLFVLFSQSFLPPSFLLPCCLFAFLFSFSGSLSVFSFILMFFLFFFCYCCYFFFLIPLFCPIVFSFIWLSFFLTIAFFISSLRLSFPFFLDYYMSPQRR